ncbi:hypothetical protein [Effusibacillus consociatus]|uniref:Uncharacterized protein n=1 Tax=Effusibacillus consociatus TaxID=1117041 RepID=A0ABV9Q4Z1_9BACL
MLNFLVVVGCMYLMHRLGTRQLIRSRIIKSRILDRASYFMFLASGCTLALYVSFTFLFPLIDGWSVVAKSIFPTAAGIWLGEFFYARNLSITLRMLQQLRKKEGRANE